MAPAKTQDSSALRIALSPMNFWVAFGFVSLARNGARTPCGVGRCGAPCPPPRFVRTGPASMLPSMSVGMPGQIEKSHSSSSELSCVQLSRLSGLVQRVGAAAPCTPGDTRLAQCKALVDPIQGPPPMTFGTPRDPLMPLPSELKSPCDRDQSLTIECSFWAYSRLIRHAPGAPGPCGFSRRIACRILRLDCGSSGRGAAP